jgi:hypothetical protein
MPRKKPSIPADSAPGGAGGILAPQATAQTAPKKRQVPAKVARQVDSLILESETPSRPALVSQALILCPLPFRRVKGTTISRTTRLPDGVLTVKFYVPEGDSLPFGNDSVLLDLLCSESRRMKSPEISFTRAAELLEKLGDNDSGASYRNVRDRLRRLANMTISVRRANAGFNVRLVDSWDLGTAKEAKQEAQGARRMIPYAIRLSPEFFDDLMRFYVPIPERVLITFKGSPVEYALMKRILHRALVARTATVMPWDDLRNELGSTDSNPRRFRADVRSVLRKLATCWEDMPLTFRVGKPGVEVSPRRVKVLNGGTPSD